MLDISTYQDVLKFEASNDVETLWPENTIYERLALNAREIGDKPAISFHLLANPRGNTETLTWAELHEKVTQFANYLRSIGVRKDDAVALIMPSSTEMVITLLASMTVGIAAPINPTLNPEKIAQILKASNAKVLVTLKSFPKSNLAQIGAYAASMVPEVHTIVEVDLGEHLKGVRKSLLSYIRPKETFEHEAMVVDFREIMSFQRGSDLSFEDTDDRGRICSYFHTGGTTGAPKIVQHNQFGAMYNGWMLSKMVLGDDEIIVSPLPLFHVFAFYPILMGAIFGRAHLILPTPAGYRGEGVIENFWKLVAYWKATFFVAVPTAIIALNQVKVNADISTLKSVFCGSAPMPVSAFQKFRETTGVEILEGYGMSEATCVVSANPPKGERRIGSVGFPLPYFDVRVANFDDDGKLAQICGIDEIGEICVASPTILNGKTYTEAEKNKDLFVEGKFMRTGDLGRIDGDGYIWLTGRSKDVINRGGNNIDPQMIEEVAMSHPMIRLAGAVGQPDRNAGELPCLYVELEQPKGRETLPSLDEIHDYIEGEIGDPMAMPKYIEIVPEIKTTAVGKTFKPLLRKRAILRVFRARLEEEMIAVDAVDVGDHPQKGPIVLLQKSNANVTDEDVDKALRRFPIDWAWE
ncbi:MAG: acyl-CoA synthetase [Pseudomonadota bacterium]